MKFGIFYELQLPRPWTDNAELELYQNALDQVELADRTGYDYAWMVEHHFLEEYSHCPSPESFLAAASQRTKNIRLGHGIFQLTTNHPARVAEEWSVLDNLSNGRVGLSFASGWMPEDFLLRPENAPPNNKAAMIRDIEVVRRFLDAADQGRAIGELMLAS